MDLRPECVLRLAGGAAETDEIPAARRQPHREALGSQPIGKFGYVRGARSEAVGISFRRQPLVVVRRRGILLLA
jgi:hypothetical protein